MRTLLLTFTFSFIFLSSWSQEKSLEKPVKAEMQKELETITFETNLFDYGELEYGSDGTCSFVFTNKGNEPLMLTGVRASCGCTAPDWSKDPIKPGDKGEIKVKYNTRLVGPFTKTITVNSNGSPSQVVLKIKGRVLPKQADAVQQ